MEIDLKRLKRHLSFKNGQSLNIVSEDAHLGDKTFKQQGMIAKGLNSMGKEKGLKFGQCL